MRIMLKQIKKWKLVVFVLVSLLYSISGITTSLILKAAGELARGTMREILLFGVGSVLLYIFVFTVMYINNVLMMSMIRDFDISFTKKALQAYGEQKLNMTDSELTAFLTQDLFLFWQQYFAQIFVIPTWSLVILVSIIFMLIQNVFLGTLFSIGGLLMVLPQILMNKRLEVAGKVYSKAKERTLEKLTDYTRFIAMFQNNNATKAAEKQTMQAISTVETAQFKFFTTHNLAMFWTGPFRGLGEVLPFVIGLVMIQQGNHMTFPVLIALFTASQQLKSPLQKVLEAFANIQSVKGLRDRVCEILALDTEQIEEKQKAVPFAQLQVRELTAGYGCQTIFQQAHVTIPMGAKVLLAGKSGVGKSTFFKILIGQLRDYSGSVTLVDQTGQEITDFQKDVALIQQTPAVFHGTLRDNVTLYQEFSDQQVREALLKVGLLAEIPDGLDCYLTGTNLSGGQTMRLEIARALLRDKQLLLADEVTAALDEESGGEIRKLLLDLPQTVIEIAHHYDLRQYDQIIFIRNQGFVSEEVVEEQLWSCSLEQSAEIGFNRVASN